MSQQEPNRSERSESTDSRGRMALRGKDSESLIYSLNLFVRSWNHYRKNTEVSQLIVPRRDHGSKSVCDDVPEIR